MQAGWLKLLILLISISCTATAQVGKLYPVDDGPKDPSFQAFRARLNVFSKFPELDPFEHSAIIGEQVRVREQPDLTSPVIASLSYDIVTITDPFEPIKKDKRSWIAIKLSNGKTGYVSEQFIRSSTDYRACFTKKGGRWRMTALVAGD